MLKPFPPLEEPKDYFSGKGKTHPPIPTDVLLYQRTTRQTLQQRALQNRSHHRFVLAFNLKTEGHVHVDNLVLPFRPGQAILILPYQFHHFSQLASNKLNWLFCTFDLQPRTFLETLRNRVVDIGREAESAVEHLLKQWHQPPSELQAEQIQVALLHLLLRLKMDRLLTGTDLPPEPKDNLLRAVNRYLADWRSQTVTVADLANALNLSASRLRVLFREVAGIPLGAYIQNYRINRAMALLRTTPLSIAEVAEEAGFGSHQAFSRIFRKKTGKTPSVYRKQG